MWKGPFQWLPFRSDVVQECPPIQISAFGEIAVPFNFVREGLGDHVPCPPAD